MIKTNLASSVQKKTNQTPWLICILFAVMAAASIQSILHGQGMPSPLEIVIWYPVLVFAASRLLILIAKKVWKLDTDQAWTLISQAILSGIGFGFLLSFLPIWPTQADAMPLHLAALGQHLLTLGVFPLTAGPDALLRGITWGAGLFSAVQNYRAEKDLFKSLFQALIVWISVSVVFLLPSLILIITLMIKGVSLSAAGQEMISEFTRFNINNYWTNAQITRWFTGFGSQAVNSFMLYSASWILAITGMAISAKPLIQSIKTKKLEIQSWLTNSFAVLVGLTVGWSHQTWSGLDVAAWLVFLVLMIFLIKQQQGTLKAGGHDHVIIWLAAALLGWPVALGILPLALFGQMKHVNQMEWLSKYPWIQSSLAWSLFALVAALFVRRGENLKPEMIWIWGGFIILVLTINILVDQFTKRGFALWHITIWIVSASIASLAIASSLPIALGILTAALLVVIARWQPEAAPKLGSILWLILAIILVLAIWIPRWNNPRLIPL